MCLAINLWAKFSSRQDNFYVEIVVTNSILFIMEDFNQGRKPLDSVSHEVVQSLLMFSGSVVNLFISSESVFFFFLTAV